jgi:hypothetical protein
MLQTIIITESQIKMILCESFSNKMDSILEKNYELTKNVLKETKEQMGINLEFLLSWGAIIGGFLNPINDYISGKHPDLSNTEISLLLTGIISLYYIDNKKTIEKILTKIKENNLTDEFKEIKSKSDELKNVFIGFIGSLGLTLHKVSNIMSYAFIIPVLPILYEMSLNNQFNNKDFMEIVKRMESFALISLSNILIKQLISKIFLRFKS